MPLRHAPRHAYFHFRRVRHFADMLMPFRAIERFDARHHYEYIISPLRHAAIIPLMLMPPCRYAPKITIISCRHTR